MNSPRELSKRVRALPWIDRILLAVMVISALPFVVVLGVLVATRGPCALLPCDPGSPEVGVGLASEGAQVTLWSPACSGDQPSEVKLLIVRGRVVDDGDDQVLWELERVGDEAPAAFPVGETPTGFIESVHLQAQPNPTEEVTAVIEAGVPFISSFRMNELVPGKIRSDGRVVSQKDFTGEIVQRCDPRRRPSPTVLRFVLGLAPLLIFGVSFPAWLERRAKHPWHLFHRRLSSGS